MYMQYCLQENEIYRFRRFIEKHFLALLSKRKLSYVCTEDALNNREITKR